MILYNYEEMEIEHMKKQTRMTMYFALVLWVLGISFIVLILNKRIPEMYQNCVTTANQHKVPLVVETRSHQTKFLYITDIHMDPLYVPDSNQKSFCRKKEEIPNATYTYGQYGCDCPEATVRSLVANAKKTIPDPAFILFGGDTLAHIMDLNIEQHSQIFIKVVKMMTDSYPNVPFMFVLGNHDLTPNYGKWENDLETFNSIANVMTDYMDAKQLKSFKKGGYYYMDFPEIKQRFLLLNTVMYTIHRPYVTPDPYDQFKWIESVCEEAQGLGYDIGAIIHIPTGMTTGQSVGWRYEYVPTFNAIVTKYGIKFVLSAHSHTDQYIMVDKKTPERYLISSPSVTPIFGNNPAYRIYYMDNGDITDYDQYYADILLNPKELDWQLEYRFSDSFNIEKMSHENMKAVLKSIMNDGELRWRYRERMFARGMEKEDFLYCVMNWVKAEDVSNCTRALVHRI